MKTITLRENDWIDIMVTLDELRMRLRRERDIYPEGEWHWYYTNDRLEYQTQVYDTFRRAYNEQ